ncbi:MAG: 6-phosphofructo-2-kinase/fructose-2,6-bisphosphatase [Thermodesulfobacteriota bacterium]
MPFGREKRLCIALVGLPARGKSSLARKLAENLSGQALAVRVFNNGELRRQMLGGESSHPDFFSPGNQRGRELREQIARTNMTAAREWLDKGGQVAVLDATNVTRQRRAAIREAMAGIPVLFVECVTHDGEILALSISHKARLDEFGHLTREAATQSFHDRIALYRAVYEPLADEENLVVLDTLHNRVLREQTATFLPCYGLVRDVLVSDWVRNLYLVRHGQTFYNLEDRLGGDSELTETGRSQARLMAEHFRRTAIPFIFSSRKRRAVQTAQPLLDLQPGCRLVTLAEFDEIDAGVCENMTYAEVRERMPEVFARRSRDKYAYVYPGGEGYASLAARTERGLKKALYLSGNAEHIMIVGHQAVNRAILSLFLYRRTEDVPYIYVPQDGYFHITATQTKKLLEMRKYRPAETDSP